MMTILQNAKKATTNSSSHSDKNCADGLTTSSKILLRDRLTHRLGYTPKVVTTIVLGDLFVDVHINEQDLLLTTALHDILMLGDSMTPQRCCRMQLFNKTHALNHGTVIQSHDNGDHQLHLTKSVPLSCLQSDELFDEALNEFLQATTTAMRLFEKQYQSYHATTEFLFEKLQQEENVRDLQDDKIVHAIHHHLHRPGQLAHKGCSNEA